MSFRDSISARWAGWLLVLMAAGAIPAAAWVSTPVVHADQVGNCQTDLWGFLASQRRLLCDGPVNGDGGWLRHRQVYTPAHWVPFTCNTYGSYSYSSTSCSGGYAVSLTITDDEVYPVFPDTVLSDEPGHLGFGAAA